MILFQIHFLFFLEDAVLSGNRLVTLGDTTFALMKYTLIFFLETIGSTFHLTVVVTITCRVYSLVRFVNSVLFFSSLCPYCNTPGNI